MLPHSVVPEDEYRASKPRFAGVKGRTGMTADGTRCGQVVLTIGSYAFAWRNTPEITRREAVNAVVATLRPDVFSL
jgi:hypothetical protein